MKKYIEKTAFVTTLVCLLPVIPGIVIYNKLPPMIPTHFDFNGNVNGYSSKNVVCFVIPFVLALANLFLHFMINNDPKKANIPKTFKTISKWIIPVVSLFFIPSLYFIALGYNFPITRIYMVIIGTSFVICGKFLSKSRQNYTVGIKLPWTLASEDNWNKTHHLAGFLWIIGGIMIILTGIFNILNLLIFIVAMLLMTVVPMFYSYWLYKKDNQ